MADTPQNDEVKNAPTASETGRIDYSHPNYSQKEIDDRLAYFYARIDEDRYIKHLSDRGESLKNLLKEMSLYGVGQRTLMQAPSDMNFEVDTEGYLKTIQAGGIYFSDRNTIRMPLDAKSEANMVCLAHEMRHAIQYKDEAMQRGAISPNPTGRFVQEKMCELETILQDVVLGAQILQRRREGGKNQYCVSGEVKNAAYFYCDEVERYQERGLSLAEAERMARTSVAQIYWTGLRELPEGLSQDDISPFFERGCK